METVYAKKINIYTYVCMCVCVCVYVCACVCVRVCMCAVYPKLLLLFPFDGVTPTLVGPEQALVMEQEVSTLLRKEAIEVVPPLEKDSGFYSCASSFLGKDAYMP